MSIELVSDPADAHEYVTNNNMATTPEPGNVIVFVVVTTLLQIKHQNRELKRRLRPASMKLQIV